MSTTSYELFGQLFEWDTEKALLNLQKHGVHFEEAATVFDDSEATVYEDMRHSEHEDRFHVVGYSKNERLLMVCHCYRDDDSIIRIISARKATKTEQSQHRR